MERGYYPLIISAGLFLSTALASQWLQKQQQPSLLKETRTRRIYRRRSLERKRRKGEEEETTSHSSNTQFKTKRNHRTPRSDRSDSSNSIDKDDENEFYHRYSSSSCLGRGSSSSSSSSSRRRNRRRRGGHKQRQQDQQQQQQQQQENFRSHYKSRRLSKRFSWDNLNQIAQEQLEQQEHQEHQEQQKPQLREPQPKRKTMKASSSLFHHVPSDHDTRLSYWPHQSTEQQQQQQQHEMKHDNKEHNRHHHHHHSRDNTEHEDNFRPKNSNWNHFERINEDDVANGNLPVPLQTARRLSKTFNDEEFSFSSDEQFVWTDARYTYHGGENWEKLEQKLLNRLIHLNTDKNNNGDRSTKTNAFNITTNEATHPFLWDTTTETNANMPYGKQNKKSLVGVDDNIGASNTAKYKNEQLRRILSLPQLTIPVQPMLRRINSAHSVTSYDDNYYFGDGNNNHHSHNHNIVDQSSCSQRVITRAQYNATIMPCKVVLVRHGQSMGNIDQMQYCTTPDNAMRLTKLGWEQARAAGKQLKEQILASNTTSSPMSASTSSSSPPSSPSLVHFIVSPYVRTVETFHGMASAWCDPDKEFGHIRDPDLRRKAWYKRLLELGLTWHEDPRIREQDFGNYQDPVTIQQAKKDRLRFGVFYYRFPHGESASDVYDRVSTFLDSLWRSFDMNRARNYVLVTHGISIRVLLARYFRYTINQFNMLSNPKNCEMIMLGHDGYGKLQLDGRYELLQETVATNNLKKKRKSTAGEKTKKDGKVYEEATTLTKTTEKAVTRTMSATAAKVIEKSSVLAQAKTNRPRAKSFSCASDYDSGSTRKERNRWKKNTLTTTTSGSGNRGSPSKEHAAVAAATNEKISDDIANKIITCDNNIVDEPSNEEKKGQEENENNINSETSTTTTSSINTDISSCATSSAEGNEADKEESDETGKSEERTEIKEYVFHKRLRVVPQKYIQKAPIRISYEESEE